MLTLYQAEWCPYCHSVRQVLTELGLTYAAVTVPAAREQRAELMAISGQDGIPVLVDGDKIYRDSDEIIAYLRGTYPAADDAEEHAAQGAWRSAGMVSLPPVAARARLRELLETKGFTIVTEVKGPDISPRLPEEYTILQVAVPAGAVRLVELDPLAPAGMMLPIAVVPTEDGNSVIAAADPVGQVWLYGDSGLVKLQSAVKKRLLEVLSEL